MKCVEEKDAPRRDNEKAGEEMRHENKPITLVIRQRLYRITVKKRERQKILVMVRQGAAVETNRESRSYEVRQGKALEIRSRFLRLNESLGPAS